MQHVFGTIGLPGSGKSTFGEVACSLDPTVDMISIGDIVRDLASSEGYETSEEISKFADRMRDEHGRGVFAKKLTEVVDPTEHHVLIVDGIRSPEEIEMLDEVVDCESTIVYIHVPDEERHRRLISRGREGEGSMSKEELEERDARERSWGVDQILSENMYDEVIENTGSLRQFEQEIEQFICETVELPPENSV